MIRYTNQKIVKLSTVTIVYYLENCRNLQGERDPHCMCILLKTFFFRFLLSLPTCVGLELPLVLRGTVVCTIELLLLGDGVYVFVLVLVCLPDLVFLHGGVGK